MILENNVDFQKQQFLSIFLKPTISMLFSLRLCLLFIKSVLERQLLCQTGDSAGTVNSQQANSFLWITASSLCPPPLPFLPYLSLSLLYYRRDVLDVLCLLSLPVLLPTSTRSHSGITWMMLWWVKHGAGNEGLHGDTHLQQQFILWNRTEQKKKYIYIYISLCFSFCPCTLPFPSSLLLSLPLSLLSLSLTCQPLHRPLWRRHPLISRGKQKSFCITIIVGQVN